MSVEFVVKLGGSLLSDMAKTRQFLKRFELVDTGCAFTVGSGPLGDAFNDLTAANDVNLPFAASVESWSHIQSVNARVIASLNDLVCVCDSVDGIEKAVVASKRPIADAFAFSAHFKSLAREHQMSDVRSALVADLLGCRKLVIFTDVEGIFSADPRKHLHAVKRSVLDTRDPLLRSRTSVDEGLAEVLDAKQLVAFVTGVDSFLKSDETFTEYLSHHASRIDPAPGS